MQSIKNRVSRVFVFLNVSLSIACSSTATSEKTAESNNDDKSSIENSATTCQLDEELIINWDCIRRNKEVVKETFENHGNKFTIEIETEGDYNLQIYAAFDNSTNKFSFFQTPVHNVGNGPQSHKCKELNLSDSLETIVIPLGSATVGENNYDSISFMNAQKRINNWVNDTIRTKWINNTFKNGNDTSMFRAFLVKISDIEIGKQHECYLALKESVDSATGEISYMPDIIVMNHIMGISPPGGGGIDSFIVEYNLEDMVYSVPPFGQGNYSRSLFPVLENFCEE